MTTTATPMTPQQMMADQQTLTLMSSAIQSIRPGAQFTISVDGYDTLLWHDEEQTKPSEEEFDAAVNAQLVARGELPTPQPAKKSKGK